MDRLRVFLSNLRMYCRLLLKCGLLYWCFLGIVLLQWYFCLLLWFWGIITGSATFIWRRNECSWLIMLLRMHKKNLFPFTNPHMAYKYLGGTRFPSRPLIVAKEGSNETWNWCYTPPVEKLSTNATVLAYIGDIPKYIPDVIFSFHFSKGWSTDKGQANAYRGQKSGCQCLGLEYALDLLKICLGVDV